MRRYIDWLAAERTAGYAADEHPYDKDPERPETFSDYNRGWEDACLYILDRLEMLPSAEADIPWLEVDASNGLYYYLCPKCGKVAGSRYDYCPNCGDPKHKGKEDKHGE